MSRRVIILLILLIAGLIVLVVLGNKTSKKPISVKTEKPALQVPRPTRRADNSLLYKKEIVTITNSGFNPETVKIKQGTRVIWENKSGNTAVIASNEHPTHLLYTPLNVGEVENLSTVQLVFEEAGTYRYHNHLNPKQKGTVVVE